MRMLVGKIRNWENLHKSMKGFQIFFFGCRNIGHQFILYAL
jgi:hypothetical protein